MTARRPHPVATSPEILHHPRSLAAFRGAKLLVGGYLALSVLALVAIVLLRDHPALVNDAVWVRGSIVVASASVMFGCAVHAARGSRGAWRRLRVISGVMVGAIVVIIVVPGAFPVWLKWEQGAWGILLIGVVLLVNGRQLRGVFAAG
ncbi:hypothetical protein ACFXN2_05355 [Streptomyces kronopolitis]|uniref:hypothetical protein n=1 Tax=Streptomyces kronopolitis TaxID=1612435 RepID=UPI0036AD4797